MVSLRGSSVECSILCFLARLLISCVISCHSRRNNENFSLCAFRTLSKTASFSFFGMIILLTNSIA